MRNKEASKNHRKGEYDIILTVALSEQEIKTNVEDIKGKVTADGKDFEVNVIEIINIFQPFKEDNPDEAVMLKSSLSHRFSTLTSAEKKKRTSLKKKNTKSKIEKLADA
jgi:hypothetical protein